MKLILDAFDLICEMLFLFLIFQVDVIDSDIGLKFYVILDIGCPVLHIVLLGFVLLLLAHNQDRREVNGIVKVIIVELGLPFVNHGYPLLVVVGLSVLDDVVVRVRDNCNDEIHEDHGGKEHAEAPEDEGEADY